MCVPFYNQQISFEHSIVYVSQLLTLDVLDEKQHHYVHVYNYNCTFIIMIYISAGTQVQL